MNKRSTSADFVTAFATGWPENQPEIMVLSLTTAKGVQDFALNKEQALADCQDHEGNRRPAGRAEAGQPLKRFQAQWIPVRVKKTRQTRIRAPLRFHRSGKGSSCGTAR